MSITSGIVEKTVEKALSDGLNELFREKKLEWTDEYRAVAEAEKKDLFASVGIDDWYRELSEINDHEIEKQMLNALAFDVRGAIKYNFGCAVGIVVEDRLFM